jgi:CBS domain-containing protein
MNTPNSKNISTDIFNVPISDLELHEVISISSDSTLKDAIEAMQKDNLGSILISENNILKGIVTERDLITKIEDHSQDFSQIPIVDFMTKNPQFLQKSNTIEDCIKLISRKEFRHIPICDKDGTTQSIVSINDILKFIINLFPERIHGLGILTEWVVQEEQTSDLSIDVEENEKGQKNVDAGLFLAPLRKVPSARLVTMDVNSSVQDILKKMKEKSTTAIALVEYETILRGIITERDIIKKVLLKHDLKKEISIKEFMTPNPHSLLSRHLIAFAINNMFHFKYRNILIVNEDRFPLFLVSLMDILKYISETLYEMGSSEWFEED